jgi:hypothetical protein
VPASAVAPRQKTSPVKSSSAYTGGWRASK